MYYAGLSETPGRGYHRDPVGRKGESHHGQRVQPEGSRGDRGLAQPTDHAFFYRRHLAQAQLGLGCPQR